MVILEVEEFKDSNVVLGMVQTWDLDVKGVLALKASNTVM